MLIHFPHGTMCSISSKNSRLFVRTCDNSSLKADRLSCLSIHILYHFFRLFALCGVALSNIALWGVALFVLHGFYGAVKETARARALRPAGQKRPGGAFLGRGLANPFGCTKNRIAMYFCNAIFVLMLFRFRIILVAYHLRHQCIALLPVDHFSTDLWCFA